MIKTEELFGCEGIKEVCGNLFTIFAEKTFINNFHLGDKDIFSTLHKCESTVYCSKNSTLYKIENNSLFKIFQKDGFDSIYKVNDSFMLLYKRISRKELYYELSDLDGFVCWSQIEEEFIDIIGERFKAMKRLDLNNFSIRNLQNQILWNFVSAIDFKIFWKIQIIGNVLFFAIDNDKTRESKSIGIDINTGKQLWEIDKSICLQINPDNNLLYGYSTRIYKVVNPKTGELLVNKSMLSHFEDGVCPYSFNNTIGGGKLWFVSGRGQNTKFGAIDLETSEMDFIQEFALDDDFQFSKPVYHDGKLYLLDSNNVLRIFE